MSCAPGAYWLRLLLHDRLDVWGLDLVPHFRNVAIWRGQIEGFYSKELLSPDFGPPSRDQTRHEYVPEPLGGLRSRAGFIPRAKLNEIEAHGANLEHAKLLGAELKNADLREAKAVSADFAARMLRAPDSRRQI